MCLLYHLSTQIHVCVCVCVVYARVRAQVPGWVFRHKGANFLHN